MAVANLSILKECLRDKKRFKESVDEDQYFKLLDVEMRLTYDCNANCIMCGVNDYKNKTVSNDRSGLSAKKAKSVIDELSEMGLRNLTLSGGEVTLVDELVEIISYASSKGNTVSINTNGQLIDAHYLDKLYEAKLHSITFSIDSPDAKLHNAIRRLPQNLEKILESIKYINSENKKRTNKIVVYVNSVLLKTNYESMVDFCDMFKTFKIDHLSLTPASISTEWDEWTTSNEQLRMTLEDVKAFKSEIVPHLNSELDYLAIDDPFGESDEEILENIHVKFRGLNEKCFVPYFHLVVQPSGDIVPCCYSPDEFVMGNINDSSCHDIFSGQKFKQFRSDLKSKKFDMCVSCNQYDYINCKIQKGICYE